MRGWRVALAPAVGSLEALESSLLVVVGPPEAAWLAAAQVVEVEAEVATPLAQEVQSAAAMHRVAAGHWLAMYLVAVGKEGPEVAGWEGTTAAARPPTGGTAGQGAGWAEVVRQLAADARPAGRRVEGWEGWVVRSRREVGVWVAVATAAMPGPQVADTWPG